MMKNILRLATIFAFLFTSCMQQPPATTTQANGDDSFKKIHDEYVVEFLRRNPTVNTYLGGAGLDPKLRDVDGALRDHSSTALQDEDRWLTNTKQSLEAIDAGSLSAPQRINRDVALAQINFLLHQHQVRRYQERALDTYTDEPFRAVDWQLQGMTQTGDKTYGTAEEWTLVGRRLAAVPAFLKVAQDQLTSGIASRNTPDWRMLIRNGIDTSEANAKYFEETLPKLAEERIAGPQRDQLLKQVRDGCQQAATAFRGLRDFVANAFFDDPAKKDVSGLKTDFRSDRYAIGEEEYNWAVRNNLRVNKTAAQLYEEAMPIVEATQKEMIELARKIGEKRALALPADGLASVRAVFDELSKDYPQV